MIHSHIAWREVAEARWLEAVALGSKLLQLDLEQTFTPQLGNLFLIGSAALAGLLFMWESLARGNAFLSLAGGLTVLGSEWVWFYEKSAEHFMVYAVLGAGLWTLGQAASRDVRWESAGRKIGYPSHVLTPMASILVVALVATILPDQFNPVDLGRFGEKLQETFPALKQLRGVGGRGTGRFSLATTGFSPFMDRLGGPVTLGNNAVLTVTVDQPLSETLYLRGATFRTYTGQTWETGDPLPLTIPKDGALLSGYAPDVLRRDVTAGVNYVAGNLGFTVFNLLEPVRVTGLKGNLQADADLNTWADRQVGKNAPYSLSARIPTYSGEQIRLLSTSEPDQQYAPFLQLPSEPLRRVQRLALNLTGGATHPYDKAVALESYLRGLPYSLDVPAPPAGQDFVDYFLFDLKTGYCVYSATAMAVMLREQGIPSRLVEGFAVSAGANPALTKDGKYAYTVTEAQAHAWVEAYFSGYGWVTFDPTPRSDLPVIDRSTPLPKTPEPSTTPEDPTDKSAPTRQNPRNLEDPATDETPSGAGGAPQRWPWSLTLLAALVGLGYLGYRRLQGQERLTAATSEQTVQEAWVKTAGLLRQFGLGRRPDQTPREYATALGQKWPDLREQAQQAAADYTAARYSPAGRTQDAEAPGRARAFWQKIENALFSRFGWRTYLWKRLRWKKSTSD